MSRLCRARARPFGQRGFTLLEITLVMAILGIALGVIVPRFRDPSQAELHAQSRRLVMTFRLLRSEAVLHGTPFHLNFDLDQGRYWVSNDDGDSGPMAGLETLGPLARGAVLKPPVEIVGIVFPTLGGRVRSGISYVSFYPDGTVDPTVIHLSSQREAFTLYVNPMNHRLVAVPGLHEIEFN